MNVSSHPNHENHHITKFYEGSPPQGPSGARRGKTVFREFLVTLTRCGGAPPGAAAFIILEKTQSQQVTFCENRTKKESLFSPAIQLHGVPQRQDQAWKLP